jgi:hypothetical protein
VAKETINDCAKGPLGKKCPKDKLAGGHVNQRAKCLLSGRIYKRGWEGVREE